MAPRQEADSDSIEAERARFTKKLDGYEAMGLDVDALRRLLDEDLERFRTTYLGAIRSQLDGGGEEVPEKPEEEAPEEIEVEKPPEETEAERPADDVEEDGEQLLEDEDVEEEEEAIEGPDEVDEPSEEVVEEEADEEMELQLEGAGPEEALAGAAIPAEDEEAPEEEPQVEPQEEPQEEPSEEGEGIPPEEAPGEEAPGEDDLHEDQVQISVEEDQAPDEEAAEEAEEEEEAPEEEAEIEVGEAPEEVPEEEVPDESPEEEALIVVAEVVEETQPPEEEVETEVRLAGLTPEERTDEEAQEPELEPEPAPPKPRPVKKVVPKKTVSKPSPPKAGPAKKAPPKKTPTKKAPPKKAAPKKPPAKKAPPKKKAPPPRRKRRAIPMSVIAMLVAAMVIVAATGIYFTVLKNEEPIALFSYDVSSPLVGEIVTFNARSSHDPDGGTIEKFVWDFGDGTSEKGMVVSHSFIEAREFTVRLTIEDDAGARDSTRRTVTVEAMEISMERPYVSDLYQYDVVGNLSLHNPEGLYTFKGPTGADEYIYRIKAGLEGDKTFEVIQTRTAKDGFLKDHDNARMERTEYILPNIKGTIETSLAVNPSFTGNMDATVEEDICQFWERGVRSSVVVNGDFAAVVAGQAWADLTRMDEGTFYSQLTGIADTFNLHEFLREQTFSSEDRETHPMPIGGGTYLWKVVGMERVEGRPIPSLHINITMDRETLDTNHLDNFFIDVWLEPGLSQPAKYHVYVTGREEGNWFMVDLTETLKALTKGSEEAWDRPCRADHDFTMKENYSDDFNQLDRVPEQGGTSGGFQFSPEDAYQEALGIPKFATFLADHPTAFFHLGNYTETGNTGTWVMTFGEFDSSEHNEIRAIGQDPDSINDVDSESVIDDTLPLDTVASIGEVVTLSRGLRLMRAEPEIGALCFDGNDVDWSAYTFNITEGVSTISLDPTSVLVGAQETGYVYLLVSRTGPVHHTGALDATNGQILFTWRNSQSWDTFDAFG
jgi:PKD repeat protein